MPEFMRCNRCGEDKPLEAFARRGGQPDKRRQPCKDCRNRASREDEKTRERSRRYREANPEKVRETVREWRRENPERAREGKRRYEEANSEQVRERRRRYREANQEQIGEQVRQWREEHPERVLELGRQGRRRHYGQVKTTVLRRYGESCACCGATEKLGIDHMDGNGGQHRTELGIKGGEPFYRWLLRMYLPPGYQTLCSRCNPSKAAGPNCRLDHSARDAADD